VTPTEQYIKVLSNLKAGEMGLLRTHAGQGLDDAVDGFDLFTGLWWPLRSKSAGAPRREVAWLIAKLYAFCPVPQSPGETLAYQLGRCRPAKDTERQRFTRRFDRIVTLPLGKIETDLRWVLHELDSKSLKLDWVKLTDDLSIWELDPTRLKWAEDFLKSLQGGRLC
jgi:CRISPR type I-E-associated protein CasB/Cse2